MWLNRWYHSISSDDVETYLEEYLALLKAEDDWSYKPYVREITGLLEEFKNFDEIKDHSFGLTELGLIKGALLYREAILQKEMEKYEKIVKAVNHTEEEKNRAKQIIEFMKNEMRSHIGGNIKYLVKKIEIAERFS